MRTLMNILMIALVIGCTTKGMPGSERSLQDGSSTGGNGLIRARTANGIRTTVRLQPPEAQQGAQANESNADSLANGARRTSPGDQLTFVINLATDGEHRKGDVMHAGVRDVADLIEQAYLLNFSWEEEVVLRCGDNSYRPVLSTLENTYGLTPDRNVVLVFAPDRENDTAFHSSPNLDLILNCGQLGTGIQHFKFNRTSLLNAIETTR